MTVHIDTMLLETVVDIARELGALGAVNPGDSRDDPRTILTWAQEFDKAFLKQREICDATGGDMDPSDTYVEDIAFFAYYKARTAGWIPDDRAGTSAASGFDNGSE